MLTLDTCEFILALMETITILLFFLVVAVVIYLTVNMLNIVRLQPVTGPLETSPMVSICVPARNEERDIGTCLESLLKQDYPHVEVIAVDDNSEDTTADIIMELAERNENLRFVSGDILPEGWLGKPFALYQAVRHAKGEYLLFTDADPVFESNAVTSAVYRIQHDNLDALTLMPGAVFGSFWEKAVQPVIFAFIAGLTRFCKINDQDSKKAMGIGAFLMFRRSAYEKIGGHEKVKDCVVEDIALAKCVKREGLKFLIADGKKVLSIRMYHSLREIWIGWRKNFFFALKKSVFWTFYYIFIILGFQCGTYLIFFFNLILGEPWVWMAISALSSTLVWVTGVKLCDDLKLNSLNAIWFPLGSVIMVAIMLNSMTQSLYWRATEWRGRIYPDS